MEEIKDEDFLKELEAEMRSLDLNAERQKMLDKKYKVLKGREHFLIYFLTKFISSYMSKVVTAIKSDVQIVIEENMKIFKTISEENIQAVKKLTGDARKEVLQITRGIQEKLDGVEGSWRQIAESLGKMSEYGLILGDFQSKSNVIIDKLSLLADEKSK